MPLILSFLRRHQPTAFAKARLCISQAFGDHIVPPTCTSRISLHPLFFPLRFSHSTSLPPLPISLFVSAPTHPPTHTRARAHARARIDTRNLCTCQCLGPHSSSLLCSLPASPSPVFCPHDVKFASAASDFSFPGVAKQDFLTFLELINSKSCCLRQTL